MAEAVNIEPATEGDTGPTPDRNVQVGLRLRAAREKVGISVRELSRRVGVSPSFISQVELGRTAPSVGTLYAIANELGLSLDTVMAAGGGSHHSAPDIAPAPRRGAGVTSHNVASQPEVGTLPGLQRADERPELYLAGVRWERLTPEDDPNVEFLRVTYPPGTESCPANNLMNHGGREYLHVLSGHLEVQVAFARQVLGPGDSLNFDSTIPHRLSNPHDQDCTAIWFVVGRQG
ncbi:XRE family transcriptional regulator with cupin sensor [Mycobacteroides abscessus subsp. bolletii]|uniref:helix-turn-helix domain-containing protein n=1 Tax=Mycobacteroides abscessus TaxID=36809 RepID=UPI00092B5541|nr:XRE family transcriptional regulator [Mycobacteroides abscessus]SIJ30593.1 XRE family transcriptional regulator with cupin sensor [Mycobacteroides abscessus subsp. bolletii]SLF73378.1 XRE family transcriptional regulator with cupin sensor [Mycobacteroides abscessus subsp. bolletii]